MLALVLNFSMMITSLRKEVVSTLYVQNRLNPSKIKSFRSMSLYLPFLWLERPKFYVGNPVIGFEYCNQLFKLEKEYAELDAETRKAKRLETEPAVNNGRS